MNKLFFTLCIFVVFGTCRLEAVDLIKAQLTPSQFGFPCCLFDFKEVAQGVNVSASFTVKNLSTLLPVSVTAKTADPFRINNQTQLQISIAPAATANFTLLLNGANTQPGPVNQLVKITAVRTGITQAIQDWTARATIVGRVSDLTCSTVVTKKAAASGNKTNITLSITLRNQINLLKSAACEGKVSIGNTQVLTIPDLPVVGSGSSASKTVTFETSKTGAQTIRVQIDTNNVNTELHEDNNECSTQVTLP
jgi:hypothetical protein